MGELTTAEQFVAGFARRMVAALAPDELAAFDPVSRAYLSDPGGVLDTRPRPEGGPDPVVLVVTPVALPVATAVYEHLLSRATDLAGRRAGRGLLRRRDPGPGGPIGTEVLEETVTGVRQLVDTRTDDQRLAAQCAELVRVLLEHHG
ncbi:hypothetical protein [Symbioplanes lichenis]|uniref:hypothetical protein n=1 Tax=Symbioplanes lichenis TaxID=1629072 RepID=UPI002738E519|nr:hypothetical protein [Actinoplanes lichenis]